MSFSVIKDQLLAQRTKDRYRSRTLIENNSGRLIAVDGKEYINFSSNDYLGLNGHPEINQAFIEGIERFGASSSSSSLVTGYSFAHQKLEEKICHWLNVERCLLFTSGFAANMGFMQALGKAGCDLILDKLSHASLIDGAASIADTKTNINKSQNAQQKSKFSRFNHNDIGHLTRKLKSASSPLVVTEGVFSMDGDKAPLAEIAKITTNAKGHLLVDDAHGIGLYGSHGEGSCIDLPRDNLSIMVTFGKALASSGAALGVDEEIYEYLVNFCRHYIYSTAMSPAQAWATVKSIELIQRENWRREKINLLRNLLVEKLPKKIVLTESQSSIIGIVLGDESTTLAASEKLKKQGIWVTAIRPPTVKIGTSRLRVTITCHHNESDINYLVEKLSELNLND